MPDRRDSKPLSSPVSRLRANKLDRHDKAILAAAARCSPDRVAGLARGLSASPRAGVSTSDLLEWLRRGAGLDVTPRRLEHALLRGRIPRPFKTAGHRHQWRVEDIDAVATYFRNPAPIGRPRKVR